MSDEPEQTHNPPDPRPRHVRRAEKRERRDMQHLLTREELEARRLLKAERDRDASQDQFRRERALRQAALPRRRNAVWVIDQFDIGMLARAEYAVLHERLDQDEQGTYASQIGSTLHRKMVGHLHRLLTGKPDEVMAEDEAREAAREAEEKRARELAAAALERLERSNRRALTALSLHARGYSLRQIAAQLGVNFAEARLLVAAAYGFLDGFASSQIVAAPDAPGGHS
ncbi:MAG TPA: hypothetical protein VFE42_20760 [Chloroflexota bacterium]|nr:hypothetical protein [Chloroflexota bacterium]